MIVMAGNLLRVAQWLLLLLSLDVAAAYSSAHNLVQPRGISTRPFLGRSACVRCQETQLMNVVVPDGMAGGQMLQVDTPAGLMQVQIPAGLAPGATFQMSVPVAAPTVPVAAPTPAAMMPPPPAVVAPPQSSSEYLKGEFAEDWAAAGRKDALLADVERFKAAKAATAPAEPEEETLLDKTIDTLGTILTFNFFIIITFFAWFLTGVAAQFGFQSYDIINTFRSSWDFLIMPLLTTHMTLTILSWGLEKVAGREETA